MTFILKLFGFLTLQLNLLDSQEIFFGFKFNIADLVDDINTFSETKKYPKVYILTFGFIFLNFQIQIQGS
jgi:hypothetical protein